MYRDKLQIQRYVNKNKFNRTTKYLFPLVHDSYNFTSIDLTRNLNNKYKLVNLYLDDDGIRKKYHNCLYCLIKVSDFDDYTFRNFFQNLKYHPLYVDYYNVDNGLIMLVFAMNEPSMEIIDLFKAGKFSEFPTDYVEIFRPETNTNLKALFNVFTKSPLLKKQMEKELNVAIDEDAELDDIPYLVDEIFRYKEPQFQIP